MHELELGTLLESLLSGRRLLTHPFYRAWCRGELSVADLRAYAEQYRHFEAELPRTLAAVVAACPEGPARALVQRNLDEETGRGAVAHLELFDRFASALGARTGAAPTAATAHLVGIYRNLAEADAGSALAAVLAYESQAAEIATSKAAGLREHHGIAGDDAEFWQVHATADRAHAEWAAQALGELGTSAEAVSAGARSAAQAWWEFLDEREAARLVAV